MSADSATRLKIERAALSELHARRPRTRVAIGILVAFAYFGVLAFAGLFISGVVKSLTDRGADRPATAQQTATPVETAGPVVEAPLPESPHPPTKPVPSVAASLPPPVVALAVPQPEPAAPAPPSPAPVAAPAPTPAPARAPALVAPAAPPVAAQPPVVLIAPQPEAPAPLRPPTIAALPPEAPVESPPPRATAAVRDAADTSVLAAAGDERLAEGDIMSARLYYERAAEAGDAHSARVLGNSYDPAFLARWGVRGMNGDKDLAARWYKLAAALGDGEAKQDLAALGQH
jgi:hypothetical protein